MKILQKKFQFQYFKNFKKLQNFHKISKLTYFIRLKKIPMVGNLIYHGQRIQTKSWSIDFNAHGILNSLPMVYRPPYQWYIDPHTLYNYWLLMRSTHDYADLVNEWLTEVNSIFNKIGYNCFIIFQDYLNMKILNSYEIFEFWNFIYFF